MAPKHVYKVTIGLNVLYALVTALFFMDAYSAVEIKWQPLKTAVYTVFILGSVLLLLWNVFALKNKLYTVLPFAIFMYCLALNPLNIVFSLSVWHTQEIVYKNRHTPAVIAYQMKDIGALGYRKRTVQVRSFTPLFEISSPAPTDYKGKGWYPVFEDVNEMALKY